MFRKNEKHRQVGLFGYDYLLGSSYGAFKHTPGYHFHHIIFKQLNEEIFAPLYSDKKSAPNSPINSMVSALLWQQLHNWTFEELERHLQFDVETRMAIGASATFGDVPFSIRTLHLFKNRLAKYEIIHNTNLIAQLFNQMTADQIKSLNVKTNIQRGDTVQLQSNIRKYSRLELLVEVVKRLYKSLSEPERQLHEALFAPYIKGSSDGFVYSLRGKELDEPLQAIAKVYTHLYLDLQNTQNNNPSFKLFEQVYKEHFLTQKEQNSETGKETITTNLIDAKELGSGILQSPDDLEATYRQKKGEKFQGLVLFANETCHPDNTTQLITAVVVSPNNVDDSVIYREQLDDLHARTPDLSEQHFDGGFGSEENDLRMKELGIVPIQTAIRGVKAASPMVITIKSSTETNSSTEPNSNTETAVTYQVQCVNPEHLMVLAILTKKDFKAVFDLDKCKNCPFVDTCPTKAHRNEKNNTATFRFSTNDVLRQERHKNIQNIPVERRKLRAGVEPLMGLFHAGEKHTGKLRVRGQFNIAFYGFAMALAINFKRIYAFCFAQMLENTLFVANIASRQRYAGILLLFNALNISVLGTNLRLFGFSPKTLITN